MSRKIAHPGARITINPDEAWSCCCGADQTKPGAWVAAHWSEPLIHTCKTCGMTRVLCRGVLTTPKQKEPTR